ncbi:hypothetical protein [Flavobacterium panacagri]|uniref:hypothetical protein n=1 Tax=Flavobacterium panacagri TaxID=3034146 RepID=UPI0025A679E4|nr:hypothetical protein [Flavobacterium panacagri]
MKTRYLTIIILFLLCRNAIAQSANIKPTGIRAVFSEKSIIAYQENSMDKISELYQYLTLFSDRSSDDELKRQLKENIFLLFSDQNIKVYDFLSSEKKLINISTLFNKIENKSYRFILKSPFNSIESESDNWVNQYHLSVTNGIIEYNFSINQKIYFNSTEKYFGTKSKTVWEIKLGEIML